MYQPSDHVLRTLAAVPLSSRVLNLGCDAHTEPLIQLGFEVHACDTDPGKVSTARTSLAKLMEAGEAEQRLIHVARRDALGYPDAFFDWIIAFNVIEYDALLSNLAEARRVLKPGGWIIIAFAVEEEAVITPHVLQLILTEANFALAEKPVVTNETGNRVVRGIFRRVDAGTPL